jgi:GrpB-like predicted nucleotidyltransferase (UPF0157 family)
MGGEWERRLREAWVQEPPRLDGAVKRQLAGRQWTYVQQYADAKSEVVEAILRNC